MDQSVTHIVRVARDKSLASETLSADQLGGLASTFRAVRWWRDRWSDRAVRTEARRVMRENGSLVIIGSGVRFDIPQPFDEFFEAIEIARATTGNDERLKTISGEAPTRQERVLEVFKWIGYSIGILAVVGLMIGFFFGFPFRAFLSIGLSGLAIGVTFLLVALLVRLRDRFFLVPGGVAVVRRAARRGRPPRITVFSRTDSCLVYRIVSTGKSSVLCFELWTHLGRVVRRAVSEREAISLLAVWQSAQAPLEDDRLEAMLCVGS